LPSDGKSEQRDQLVRTGRTKGFVLYDDIDKFLLPYRVRETAAELDDILSQLTMNSIEVRDEPRTEDSIPDENSLDHLYQQEFQDHASDSTQVRMYLREVLTVSRLTDEAEKELARRFKPAAGADATARLYATDGSGRNYYGPGTTELSPAMKDAEEAGDRLIEANLWITLATATHYTNRGLGFLDLIQEGNIGLMRAVKEYNYLRQYRFSTYATWWVRRAIIRAIEDFSK